MAHQISVNNGKAEMFYYGERPWHGLGTKVEGALTSAEAITTAGLDWKVQKVPVMYNVEGTYMPPIKVEGKYVNYRSDTLSSLGVVGKDYTIVQNKEAFSFFDAVVGEKAAMYHTAGALFGGRKIWLLAKLPQDTIVKGVDISKNYLLLSNSHDGSSNLRIMWTSVRVVCNNTLTSALQASAGNVSMLRHTSNIGQRVKQVQEFLGITGGLLRRYEEHANMLASKDLSHAIVEDFFERMGLKVQADGKASDTRKENVQYEILELLEKTNKATPEIKNTRWALFNAFTDYVDHSKTVRPSSDEDKWADSILFGSGAEAKRKALQEVLAI